MQAEDLRNPSFSTAEVSDLSPISTISPVSPMSPSSSGTLEATLLLPNEGTDVRTPGSLGHPEVCRRQCIYFLAGHCSNGDACTYCHLPHPQKAPKLDKRQRTLIQGLSYQQLLGLILHLCKPKAEEIGMVKESQEVISILTEEAGTEGPPPMSDRDNRALCKTLSRMNLASNDRQSFGHFALFS